MRETFERLQVPFNTNFTDSLEENELELDNHFRPNVTCLSTRFDITIQGITIPGNVHIRPGEYYRESGGWNRRYGGEYEIISLTLYNPADTNQMDFLNRGYYIRSYGSYNRRKVNGEWRWVRLDSYEDFLEIDNTIIQQIIPVTPDYKLDVENESKINGLFQYIKSTTDI